MHEALVVDHGTRREGEIDGDGLLERVLQDRAIDLNQELTEIPHLRRAPSRIHPGRMTLTPPAS
jgi:hypothetical protein